MVEIIVAGAIGLLIGFLLAYLFVTGRHRDATSRHAVAITELEGRLATAEARREAAVARADQLASDRGAMVNQFRSLSDDSMHRQSARTQELFDPLTTTLRDLQQRITQVEKERTQMAAELREQISSVKHSGESVRREASALATALRTPQVRGAWGEQSLRRMVEISGLTARCDFDEQPSYETHSGDRLRPDMRINLADGKTVFVDSKVPLAAVIEAYNTDDPAVQDAHLTDFARHVRGHIDALSKKDYWALDSGSPEFVVLYLPSDEFYRLAQEQIPDLHDYAARRNIMLSCPGTLIPLLHIVAHGWKQAALAESAVEISRLGRELYERLATMGGHFGKLRRSLDGAVTAFNSSVASLETRVFVTARKFNELQLVSAELPEVTSIESAPRQLTAPELQEWGA